MEDGVYLGDEIDLEIGNNRKRRKKRGRKRKRSLKDLKTTKISPTPTITDSENKADFKKSAQICEKTETVCEKAETTREKAFPTPFIYCRFVARFPVISFCE